MKKAILLLAAAALLCGMISGCSMFAKEEKIENSGFLQQTQSEKAPVQGSATEPQAELTDNRDSAVFAGNALLASQTVLTLHITINPDLVVFSDASGLIIAMQPLNEDANTLLTAANVTGKPVEEGLAMLLSAAHEQGFLKEGAAEIQIEPSVHNGLNWTEELETALTKIVTDFETEKNLQLELTVKQPEITETSGSFTQQAGTASVKEWTEASTGDHYTVYYNEEGKPVRSTVKEKDGDVGEYTINPENEKTISVLWVHPDGSYSDNYFDDNGVLTTLISMDAMGNYGETTFLANGNPATTVSQYADGRRSEIQYYENGKYKFILTTYPDGMIQEDSYTEEEVLTLTICKKPDGSYMETTYYASGMRAKYTLQEANGYYSVIEYYDSPNGTVNSNGNFKSSIMEGNGFYDEEHYRQDGSLSYSLHKRADAIWETTYNEKGAQTTTAQYFDGDVTHSEWQTDAFGNMTYSKNTYKDGTVVEQWFSGGNVTKTLVNGVEQSNS